MGTGSEFYEVPVPYFKWGLAPNFVRNEVPVPY